MEIERTKEIFRELAKLSLDLPKDPLSLGPDFLREQISICRNYLNQTSFYLQEVLQEHHMLALNLEDLRAQYQIQSDELLANDSRVKMLPHIEDRQAMINVTLSLPLREIQRLEREVTNLKHIEKVVRLRLKELDNTMSAIRLQRSLLRDQIRVGGAYGDESDTSRGSNARGGSRDPVDEMSGDDIARLIDESEAEVAGTPKSVVQFDDEEEELDEETPNETLLDEEPLYTEAAKNGLLCSLCGEPQYNSRSGEYCKNGHGGAPGVKPSKKKPPLEKKIEPDPDPDPDQDLLDELDDLIGDGDDGKTIITPDQPLEESKPAQDVGVSLKVHTNPLTPDDVDEDMQRFLEEDTDDIDDIIADI